jgi:hypothetical protein
LIKNLFQNKKSLSWAAAFLVILSVGSLVYSAKCGLGITYDSQNYLAAAESMAKSGTLETQFGEPYMAQPPFLFSAPLLQSSPCVEI